MLELKQITKEYETGGEVVHALKGVDLAFRESEFVSILGPSGCGKTTLLNIMGGLDQYTTGDLIINGVSTKEYADADWDAYRNNSIGFVFQSYNLIPHQTVLANVELALTLSGVSAEERHERAIKALEEVGLGDQMNKKPAQMSGGQMQRVAIARALINNPDILLADEPTGALDSETSVQIMGLLKKIAANKLVIMVTHNPDLAKEYSTRIVNLQDGKVVGDSNPCVPVIKDVANKVVDGAGKLKNKSMSFKTALQLSLNNLMTKKARTLLTAFAGSIGIIGIALILSVSSGFQNYIDQMENDTLTSYPLTLNSEKADMTSMISAFSDAAEDSKTGKKGQVKEQQLMTQMFASIGTNDLRSFNKYTNNHLSTDLNGCFNAIQYSYGIKPQLYLNHFNYGVQQVCPSTIMSTYMNGMQQTALSFSNTDNFFELIDNEEMNKSQYTVVAGNWPKKYNELVLILPSEHSMSDYFAYSLGLRDPEEMKDMIEDIMSGNEVKVKNKALKWSYKDLLKLEYSLVPASAKYKYNGSYDVWEDMSSDDAYMKDLIAKSEKVKITCIAIPNKDNTSSSSVFGVGFLPSLTQHCIEVAAESDIVKHQKAQQKKDVFSGKTFEQLANGEDTSLGFGNMISIDQNKLKKSLGGDMNPNAIKQMIIDNAKSALQDVDPTQTIKDVMATAGEQATKIISSILEESATDSDPAFVVTKDAVEKALANNPASGEMSEPINTICEAYCDDVIKTVNKDGISGSQEQVSGALGEILYSTMLNNKNAANAAAAYAEGIAIKKTAENVPSAMGKVAQDMGSMFNVDPAGIASAFNMSMGEEELTRLISSYMSSGEDASYESNLRSLGYADINNPYSISYYMTNFESKEKFMDFIDSYNDDMEAAGDDEQVISYTDITGVLLKSVKKITNAVSYVLIAFVAISLIVSSIMIGVITYISVLERTKEIGILRAIGASKKDISRIFNAETVIVGLCAGVIGIVTSLLLLIPINAILIKLTGIAALKAILPAAGAIILILISVLLTFVAGLIPSGMAAKKDPVIALRSE